VLTALRKMLSNSLVSRHTERAYLGAFNDLCELAAGRPISRLILMEYRASMVADGLSAATINQRLCAIRKLVNEARDSGLIDPAEAVRLTSVPGVPQSGVRLGRWLTKEETQLILATVDRTELIGKRNFAILSVLCHCALRREEQAKLDTSLIQRREGRWVIADLIGKRGRVRTVPIPQAAKDALDEWTRAAEITSGPIFRRMRKGGAVTGIALSAWTIWEVVVTAAKAAGIDHLGPHDLRRTCAKLCRKAGGELEQIQALLGHEDLSTTSRYLNSTQQIQHAGMTASRFDGSILARPCQVVQNPISQDPDANHGLSRFEASAH
jgi:integrase